MPDIQHLNRLMNQLEGAVRQDERQAYYRDVNGSVERRKELAKEIEAIREKIRGLLEGARP